MRFQECIKKKCVSQRWKKECLFSKSVWANWNTTKDEHIHSNHATNIHFISKEKKPQQVKLIETEVSGQVVRICQAYFVECDNAGHIFHIKSNTIIRVIRELNLFRAFFILQNTHFGYSAETEVCANSVSEQIVKWGYVFRKRSRMFIEALTTHRTKVERYSE